MERPSNGLAHPPPFRTHCVSAVEQTRKKAVSGNLSRNLRSSLPCFGDLLQPFFERRTQGSPSRVFVLVAHDAFSSRATDAKRESRSRSAACFLVILPVDLAC